MLEGWNDDASSFQPSNRPTFRRRTGYRATRLRYAPPRRRRHAVQHRHDRDPGPAARRAADPPPRTRHLPLALPARAESGRRHRRCRGPRRNAESDSGHGDVSRRRSRCSFQSRRPQHHLPRPAVSPDRHRGAVPDVELLPARRAAAGGCDLPVRAGHQRPRAAHGQLPGARDRRLEPLVAAARSGARARQGARAAGSETRFWRDVVHRTPAESAHSTLISRPNIRTLSQLNATNAADHAAAVRPSGASTVTDCGRRALVLMDPLRSSTAASMRSELAGSGMPTDRRVAGPIQRYWAPRASSALSTAGASTSAARSSAYPAAKLSALRATPVRRRMSRAAESSAAIRGRPPRPPRPSRRSSESRRSTLSCAAANARATRAVSALHAAADSIAPSSGHTRDTAGRGSARQLARLRQSRRLILKWDW